MPEILPIVLNPVVTTAAYSNPSWLTALAASKLTGVAALANLPAAPTAGLTSSWWSDSTFDGHMNSSVNFVPAQFGSLTGRPTDDESVSGQTASQIATRFLAATTKWTYPSVFTMGRNDIDALGSGAQSTIISNLTSCINALQSVGNTSYVICAILPRAAETSTPSTPARTTLDAINAAIQSLAGSHYHDPLPYLQAHNDGSANDLADVTAGVIPRSLREDDYHYIDLGGQVAAADFYANTLTFLNGPSLILTGAQISTINAGVLAKGTSVPGSIAVGSIPYVGAGPALAYDSPNFTYASSVLTVPQLISGTASLGPNTTQLLIGYQSLCLLGSANSEANAILITATTDQNVYLNRPSGKAFIFEEALSGSNQLYISTGGNIGISTNNASHLLTFPAALGPKQTFYAGLNYGNGIQSSKLQYIINGISDNFVWGYGTSAALTQAAQLTALGVFTTVGSIGVNGSAAPAKPTVTGSRGGNAALASFLTAMASYGFITDSTTA